MGQIQRNQKCNQCGVEWSLQPLELDRLQCTECSSMDIQSTVTVGVGCLGCAYNKQMAEKGGAIAIDVASRCFECQKGIDSISYAHTCMSEGGCLCDSCYRDAISKGVGKVRPSQPPQPPEPITSVSLEIPAIYNDTPGMVAVSAFKDAQGEWYINHIEPIDLSGDTAPLTPAQILEYFDRLTKLIVEQDERINQLTKTVNSLADKLANVSGPLGIQSRPVCYHPGVYRGLVCPSCGELVGKNDPGGYIK